MSDQPIPLRTLLGELRPGDCKLHCAVWNGEEHPIEVMARYSEEWTWLNLLLPVRGPCDLLARRAVCPRPYPTGTVEQ